MENNLQKILDKQGKKKSWLAKVVGVSANTITNYLKGAEPRLRHAYRIAKALNRSVYEIWPDLEVLD